MRVYLATQRYPVRAAPVLTTVVLERIVDFLTILVIVAAIIPVTENVPDELLLAAYICGATCLAMILAAGLHAARPEILTRLCAADDAPADETESAAAAEESRDDVADDEARTKH